MYKLILRIEGKSQEIKGNNMRKKLFFIFLFMAVLIFGFGIKSNAAYDDEEKIVDYDIEIHVNKDASMDVKEKITVNALGYEIQHGIYRDFPTQYNNKTVSFKINDVTLDGEDVKYITEGVDRGVRIKIGSSNDYVSEGLHTYVIDYTTERQMFFEDDYDELYWNLIGSGWNFDIEECSARVYFPKGTEILEDDIKAYVGAYGDSEEADDVYYYVDNEESCVYFNMFYEIPSENAFTVVVRVEKGAIDEPDLATRFNWFLQDNLMFVIVFIGMIGLGIWQFIVWKKYGKDPEKNVIIPKYYPPEGMDVGDVKYMDRMGSTDRVLEATFISLATKGFLKFNKGSGKNSVMTVEKTYNKNPDEYKDELSEFERDVYRSIGSKEDLGYSPSLYDILQKLKKRINQKLADKYDNKMFFKNIKYSVISIVVSVILFAVGAVIGTISNPYITSYGIENIMTLLATAFVFSMVILICKDLIKAKSNRFVSFIFILLWGVPFLIFGVAMFWEVLKSFMESIFQAFIIVGIVLQNYLFIKWIPRYTEEGMRIKEDIDGYKMFINVAKDDDFKDKTPEMFDKYFSYAYVLGLENKWANKFEEVLKQANYSPSWCSPYMFNDGVFDCAVFTSSFSSTFSSSMSSASTAPASSSSSSGGGGFSGGGGGGRRPEVAGKKQLLYYVKCDKIGTVIA